jgi:hypothetical protein
MTINDTIGAKLTHFLALDNENKVRKSKKKQSYLQRIKYANTSAKHIATKLKR